MENRITAAYVVIAVACFIFIITSMIYTGEELHDNISEYTRQEIIPVSEERIDKDTRVIKFNIDQTDESIDTFIFLASHQNVTIEVDGKQIYEMKKSDRLWTQTDGTAWHIAHIPMGAETVTVTLTAIYDAVRDADITFYIGNGATIEKNIAATSLIEVIICMADIFLGILMVIYWIAFSRTSKISRAPLFLGIFSALVGCWSFLESNFAIGMLGFHSVNSLAGFVCIALWMVPFNQFVKIYYDVKRKGIADAISIVSLINIAVMLPVHALNIAGMKQTVTASHILILCSFIYFIYGIITYFINNGMNNKSRMNLIAASVLMVAVVIDFYLYYSNSMQREFAGRLGLLIYLCIICGETVKESIEQISEGRKAQIYKELAETDALTGLLNRHAYTLWENEHQHDENVTIVNLDLNELKKVNDTLGHAKGDKYIIDAANVISSVYGKSGSCYRVGGDEFCVIVNRRLTDEDMRSFSDKMRKLEDEYNAESKDILMQIAYGYARYDGKKDSNFENTRSRADARMYANKRQRKSE